MKIESTRIDDAVRLAFARSGWSRYRLAKESRTAYSTVHGFVTDGAVVSSTTLNQLLDAMELVVLLVKKEGGA